MLPFLNLTPFPAFTSWTSVIPKMYWDVYSAEQRLKAICERLCKSEAYMDYVANTINDYTRELDGEVERVLAEVREEMRELDAQLRADMATLDADLRQDMAELDADLRQEMLELFYRMNNIRAELIELILEIGEGHLTWDVQHGMFTDSITAQRDMFNDVTIHALTCEQLDAYDVTVADVSESGLNVRGFATLNYRLIDSTQIIYPDCLYTE